MMRLSGGLLKSSVVAALLAAAALSQACGGGATGGGARTGGNAPQGGAQTRSHAPAASHATPAPQQADAHAGHSHGSDKGPDGRPRVPAYAQTSAELRGLAPVLSEKQFVGMTRLAYKAVAEIPQVIAQLPCYCYCDQGHGHKSLHTCFTDDHAAHCAVCVEEALLAHRLHKEKGLSPEKIREIIVAQYSQAQ